jgi:hypothetical protein
MLNGIAVEFAVGTEVEEMFWTVALLTTEELDVTSLAEGEKEVDSVCKSLVAVELDSLEEAESASVEV